MKRVLLAIIASVLIAPTVAKGDVLLSVDLSVVDQITVSATSGLSAVDASGSDSTGVYLEGFYGVAGGALNASLVSGDLTNAENPSDSTPSLFRGDSGADPGLNLWSWSSDSTVTFTAGSLAFTGSATWTLDSDDYADMLAGATSGEIYFPADTEDDIAGGAVSIGQYEVFSAVPEPSSLGLIAALGVGAILRRRRI